MGMRVLKIAFVLSAVVLAAAVLWFASKFIIVSVAMGGLGFQTTLADQLSMAFFFGTSSVVLLSGLAMGVAVLFYRQRDGR
jgi:hypothetical protein